MKRRTLISSGLSGLLCTLGQRAFSKGRKTALTTAAVHHQEALFHFAVAGDVGTGKRGQYDVAGAMVQRWQSSSYFLTLLLGDNIYENGEIEKIQAVFERPYASLLQREVQFRAVLGNHDVRIRQGSEEMAYARYNMPSRYYTFTQPSVQFFALDTNKIYRDARQQTFWQAQLRWLKTELARSQAQWKVVFAHHPIYSSGRHGFNRELADDLSPIFAEYGVQLYINGHDHHYERTHPINGTTYITSGNGAKLRRVGHSDWTAFASSRLGFTTFSIQRDRILVSAIDTHNAIYDQAFIV